MRAMREREKDGRNERPMCETHKKKGEEKDKKGQKERRERGLEKLEEGNTREGRKRDR